MATTPPDAKNQLIGKDSNAGKDWGQEEKGVTEDETVGWHHWLNGLEFEQVPGDGEGREAWCAAVGGLTESQGWLRDEQPPPPPHTEIFLLHDQVYCKEKIPLENIHLTKWTECISLKTQFDRESNQIST